MYTLKKNEGFLNKKLCRFQWVNRNNISIIGNSDIHYLDEELKMKGFLVNNRGQFSNICDKWLNLN